MSIIYLGNFFKKGKQKEEEEAEDERENRRNLLLVCFFSFLERKMEGIHGRNGGGQAIFF